MPNHVINELIFRGVVTEVQGRILAAICNAEGKVDFEVLVPMPLNMWWGSAGSQHEAAFKRTALSWSRENWGTKWNAYDQRPVERSTDTLVLRFETAWNPPYPWLAAVFNKLSLPFEHNWLDEGAIKARSGTFQITDKWGPEWKEIEASDEMQRHLHKLLFGVEEFTDAA